MVVHKLSIVIDNFGDAAMVDDRTAETCRVLRELVDSMEDYGIPNANGAYLRDSNGNYIGLVYVDFVD